MRHFFDAFKKDDRGVTALEYAILAGIVVVAVAALSTVISGVYTTAFSNISTIISTNS
jgi:pilus assembly protein Flp/PilA